MFTRRISPRRNLACGLSTALALLWCTGHPVAASAVTATRDPAVKEYPILAGASAEWITAGPDGNVWFTESGRNVVGHVSSAGVVTEIAMPHQVVPPDATGRGSYTIDDVPQGIAVGSDGNLWIVEYFSGLLVRVTPGGVFTTIAVAGRLPYNHWGIAAGPDGNLWIADGTSIDRISVADVVPDSPAQALPITSYTIPAPSTGVQPLAVDIAAGHDGNLWFVDTGMHSIGRITTAGAITEFHVPGDGFLGRLCAGPDGNVWFTEIGKTGNGGNPTPLEAKVAVVTPTGAVYERRLPNGAGGSRGIVTGRDHAVWIAEAGGWVDRVTTLGEVTEYQVGDTEWRETASTPYGGGNAGGLWGITAGPDGNIWFTEMSPGNYGVDAVGRVDLQLAAHTGRLVAHQAAAPWTSVRLPTPVSVSRWGTLHPSSPW